MASATEDAGGLSQIPSPTFSAASTAKSSTPSNSACKRFRACSDYDDRRDKNDASKDLKQPCHGWPKLVEVMAENPGFESFQPFRDLNIKSLLYYQAQLVQLRKELHALEWKDHRKGGDSADLCSSVRMLLQTEKGDSEDQKQLNKIKEIRTVLKEYNAALLQYAQINELPQAETFNVKSLRTWIEQYLTTDLYIAGPGSETWGKLGHEEDSNNPPSLWSQFGRLIRSIFREEKTDNNRPDLVVPRKPRDIDALTRWVACQWIPFWNNFSETPFCKFFYSPFGKTDGEANNEKFPGGILAGCYSTNCTPSNPKRWRLFRRTKPTSTGRKEEHASLATYSMKGMIRFTNRVATVIACLLPIAGIAVLSRLHTLPKILGFLTLFTGIFAIGLMILTDSGTSRTEIFTATAAFTAVLVVFVQNQSSGGAN